MFEMQHDETKAVNETKSYDSIKKIQQGSFCLLSNEYIIPQMCILLFEAFKILI